MQKRNRPQLKENFKNKCYNSSKLQRKNGRPCLKQKETSTLELDNLNQFTMISQGMFLM